MPVNSKKNHGKNKDDPKEQRQSRRSGPHHNQVEKKPNKKVEESKPASKEIPQKPVEDPGPEFYNNLKRETDEILKITEEENSKYRKKEIKSNWSKYEIPIDTYEEMEEQEYLGADFEKLIEAPLSIGGHFQFKHEKSWNIDSGPSLYDKYFDINMNDLALAISSIPFYERNCIETSLFDQNDILAMDNRASRYKQRYFDKIVNKMRNEPSGNQAETTANNTTSENLQIYDEELVIKNENKIKHDINIDNPCNTLNTQQENKCVQSMINTENKIEDITGGDSNTFNEMKNIESKDINLVINPNKSNQIKMKDEDDTIQEIEATSLDDFIFDDSLKDSVTTEGSKTKIKPVIESPEDLEKWLDDFLDS